MCNYTHQEMIDYMYNHVTLIGTNDIQRKMIGTTRRNYLCNFIHHTIRAFEVMEDGHA